MSKISDIIVEVDVKNEEAGVVNKKSGDGGYENKEWTNPIEYMMTCIGFAVGLGNIWRFPMLVCMHYFIIIT